MGKCGGKTRQKQTKNNKNNKLSNILNPFMNNYNLTKSLDCPI